MKDRSSAIFLKCQEFEKGFCRIIDSIESKAKWIGMDSALSLFFGSINKFCPKGDFFTTRGTLRKVQHSFQTKTKSTFRGNWREPREPTGTLRKELKTNQNFFFFSFFATLFMSYFFFGIAGSYHHRGRDVD